MLTLLKSMRSPPLMVYVHHSDTQRKHANDTKQNKIKRIEINK